MSCLNQATGPAELFIRNFIYVGVVDELLASYEHQPEPQPTGMILFNIQSTSSKRLFWKMEKQRYSQKVAA